MPFEQITLEKEADIAIVTLNRPERRNAMSDAMVTGLVASLDDAETATDVGAVLLTGAGGAFCAGGDVKGMAEAGAKVEIAPSNTMREFTYSDAVSAIRLASCMNSPNRQSPHCLAPQRERVCR